MNKPSPKAGLNTPQGVRAWRDRFNDPNHHRDVAMTHAFAGGMRYVDIAKAYNLSESRVRQIVVFVVQDLARWRGDPVAFKAQDLRRYWNSGKYGPRTLQQFEARRMAQEEYRRASEAEHDRQVSLAGARVELVFNNQPTDREFDDMMKYGPDVLI
jgi:hypothetical protein